MNNQHPSTIKTIKSRPWLLVVSSLLLLAALLMVSWFTFPASANALEGQTTYYLYSTQFACAPNLANVISIQNTNLESTTLTSAFLVLADVNAATPGREPQQVGVSATSNTILSPGNATMFDCPRILELLQGQVRADTLTIGRLAILSQYEIDVDTSYVAINPDNQEPSVSIEVERVPGKPISLPAGNRAKVMDFFTGK